MSINNALALAVQTPQLDFSTPLMKQARLREADTQNALAQVQLQYAPQRAEAEIEGARLSNQTSSLNLSNATDRRNALAKYKETGDETALKGQPDLHAQIITIRSGLDDIERKKYDERLTRNAKGAQRVLGIADPNERAVAWKEELDTALAEKRIDDATHKRLSTAKPDELTLGSIVKAGLSLQSAIELEQKDKDRTVGREFSANLGRVFSPAGAAPGAPATKPAIHNSDGSFSTERTITVEADGKHYNIPTIVGGRQLSADEAVNAWRAGKNAADGEFATRQEAEAAARARSTSIGTNTPRGLRNNNPLNIEAGKFTEGLPGYAGSDGRFAKFQSPEQGIAAADRLLVSYNQNQGIDTVQGVINRWAPATENDTSGYAAFVANKIGVKPGDKIDLSDPAVRQSVILAMGEFENGRPITGGGKSNITPASASQHIGGVPSAQLLPFLAQSASMPGLPKEAREMATELMKTILSEAKPSEKQKHYLTYVKQETDAGREPKTQFEYEKEIANAGSTKNTVEISQKAESASEIERRGGLAKQLTAMAEAGREAGDQEQLVGRLGNLLEKSGTGANIAFTNWVRSNTGIKLSAKADAAEAANAIISFLKPRMRAPGSGATSDRDMTIFANAIPSLLSTPEGKRIVIETLGGMYSIQRARGEVAERWQVGDIDDKQAVKELRGLEDPFKKFREFQSKREGKSGVVTQDVPVFETPEDMKHALETGAIKSGAEYRTRDGRYGTAQ